MHVTEYTCRCGKSYPRTAEHFNRNSKSKDGLTYECKKCLRAKTARYRAEHPEKEQLARQKTYKKHKESLNARSRAAYAANREQRKAVERKRYRENREARLETIRRYRQANVEKYTAAIRRWNQNNPEAVKVYRRRQRDRRRGATGGHTLADIHIRYAAQKGLCHWCYEPLNGNFQVDHIIPIARGGSDDPENICCSCQTCNQKKNAKLPHEFCGRLF